MKKRSWEVLLMGALLAWTLGGAAFALGAEPLPTPVILCFGDSLTAGMGVGLEDTYPALLQKRLQGRGFPHKVANAGVSGDTASGGIRRLGWAMGSRPSLVILELGVNDGMRGADPKAIQKNLAEIIETFQKRHVRVILAGMRLFPNYGVDATAAFARIYPELAASHHLPLIPFLLEGVAGNPKLNQEDGIHPNAEGYRIVLENVWKVLQPELSKP